MAVEDFVLFKKMMVNKNIQMNKEALRQMQAKGGQTNHISGKVDAQVSSSEEESDEEDEEEMMRKAIEASKKQAELDETYRKIAADKAEAEERKQIQEVERIQEEAKAAEAQAQAATTTSAQPEAPKRSMGAAAGFSANSLPALGGLPSIGGTAGLPALGAHKPKSTGLALFDEIEITENDSSEVTEEKEQRRALK